MAETKLTTVKIIKNLYSKFKKISFDSNITLQKLVNRSVDKYIEDEDYYSIHRLLEKQYNFYIEQRSKYSF